MISFILCVIAVFIGLRMIRRSSSGHRQQLDHYLGMMDTQLKARKHALDIYAEALQRQQKSLDVLDKMTAEDAIKRETRAKAALRAVLLKDGCSQHDIEMVMAEVDGTEDGDLKT